MHEMLLVAAILSAGPIPAGADEGLIWDSSGQRTLTLEEFTRALGPGQILVFGEQHSTPDNENEAANVAHHARQALLLERLTARAQSERWHLNTGMEFLTYPHQIAVDRYVAGDLDEATFLAEVKWGPTPFGAYRRQIRIPAESGGRTVALNIPAAVSRQVAKAGPGSLSEEQKALLPPIWERGRPEYFERFKEAAGGHAPPEKLENYFWAQSLWEDTMAWNALKQQSADPLSLQVIVVGEFHAEFGLGLKSRLLRHGAGAVRTLLQQPVASFSDADVRAAVAPDAVYGERADYLWLHQD